MVRMILQQPVDHLQYNFSFETWKKHLRVCGGAVEKNRKQGVEYIFKQVHNLLSSLFGFSDWLMRLDDDDDDRSDNESVKMIQQIPDQVCLWFK